MEIFHFEDYRQFIRARLETSERPRKRGELARIAAALGVERSYFSQILSGKKNLSHEQAFSLAQYLGLTPLERRYLFELVHLTKATKKEFIGSIREEMRAIQREAAQSRGENTRDQPLSEQNQVIFYSSWAYSAVQLLTGLDGGRTRRQIADHLSIESSRVDRILDFLVSTGLCRTDGVRYHSERKSTHLSPHSPLRGRHQTNWRLKALENLPKQREEDLYFTAAIRLDERSYEKIRLSVEKVIAEAKTAILEADDTRVACLNIDWFKI